MVKVRIYLEGGGDSPRQRKELRIGFQKFLERALPNIRKPKVVPCGGRGEAYKDFRQALKEHTDSYCILLVDSEGIVEGDDYWAYLTGREKKWERPASVTDDQCQLMIRTMEAWFMADVEALQNYFGQNFNPNPIRKTQNVEDISKQDLKGALSRAVKDTQKAKPYRGEYNEIKHGGDLLAEIDPGKVRKRSKSCDRLLTHLEDKLS